MQQPEMTWNGSAWVPASMASSAFAATTAGYSQYTTSTYPQQQQQQQQQAPPAPQNLVQTYTQYYHEYTRLMRQEQTSQEQQQQQHHHHQQQQQPAHLKTQAQEKAAWYKYQADQSSRAAHHFHANPGTTAFPFGELPPPPPPLSLQHQQQLAVATAVAVAPAPPQNHYQQQQQNYQHQHQQQNYQHQSATTPAVKVNAPTAPSSLQRFVDRCLAQCSASMPQEKTAMVQQVEQRMAAALKEGSFHSINWDTVPLLPVTGRAATAVTESATAAATATGGDYYGPSSTTAQGATTASYYGSGKASTNSYYGAAASGTPNAYYGAASTKNSSSYYGPAAAASSTLSSFTHHSFHQQQQSPLITGNSKSKKRKHAPAERKNSGFKASNSALEDRAKRFAGLGGLADTVRTPSKSVGNDFAKYMGKETIGGSNKPLTQDDYEQMTVKGTCQVLEKEYLRLTAPPRAERVRSRAILQEHLTNLKEEQQRMDSRREYLWFCSQLKAVRQDCRVQRIVNAFTVDVYETHARMALEEGDLNEFNQCQTQLKELYELLRDSPEAVANRNEFVAYRLVYFVFLTCNNQGGGSSSADLFHLMLALTPEQKQDVAIRHALQIRVAVADWDYHLFFGLYKDSPNLGLHLMDRIVPHMRKMGLQVMARAYRPAVEAAFVLQELGLTLNEEFGRTWLVSCGCVLSEDGSQIQTKDSVIHESDLEEKQSLI